MTVLKKCLVPALVMLVCITLCIPSAFASEQQDASPMTLLALGDSLTTGYGLDNYVPGQSPYLCSSYVNIIAQTLGLEGGSTYINRAVNGDRSADLARLIPSLEAEVRSADLIIITIGGNDLLSIVPAIASQIAGKSITSFEQAMAVFSAATSETYTALLADPAFCQQMEKIFAELDANLKTIMGFIQQTAPDARVVFLKQYNPFKNVPGFVDFGEFAGRMLDSINQGVESNALAYGFEVVDTTSVIEADAMGLTNIAQNDIHPNEAGHAEIAKLLAEHLGLSEQGEQETSSEQSSAAPETDASTSEEQDTNPPAPEVTAPEATEQESEPSYSAPAAPKDHSGCAGSVGLLSVPLALLVGILAKKKLK